METVTVKTASKVYDGSLYGVSFHNGEAKDVPVKLAERMVKENNAEIVKPEKPKEAPKAKAKTKAKTKAKAKTEKAE